MIGNPYILVPGWHQSLYHCTSGDGKEGNSVGGGAGYLFFQTRDGFNFRSIDRIFKGDVTKKYIYNNTGKTWCRIRW